jgi:capsular exopolysaccharide synthesis family protein
MEAQFYWNAFRRSWWLILLGPILAAGTAFFYSQSLTPLYSTSSTLLVNQTQVPGAIQYNDVLTSERLTNTYAALLREQRAYLGSVIEQLDLPLTEGQLASKIEISAVSQTQLLRITVEDASPALAALIANTLGEAFITENANALSDSDSLTVAVAAAVPGSPSSPNVRQNTILAAMLGLMIVGAVAVLIEYLDDTLKAEDETDLRFGLPTLGLVRRLQNSKEGESPLTTRGGIEAYAQLRTNVHFAGLGKPLKKLVVTGSMPGEGKTTTAAGLAIALSQAGQRVILVDTDLRRPTLHKMFQVSNSYGITGLLLSRSEDPKNALMATSYENLMLLPSGPVPANPADLLMSPNWQHLTDKLCEIAHYVIFDTPPALSVSDASILAGRADGTILVAETGRTRRNAIREALVTLEHTNSHLLGIVKNKVKSRKAAYYYYEYGSSPDKRRRRVLTAATVVVPSGTPEPTLRPSTNGRAGHTEEERVA